MKVIEIINKAIDNSRSIQKKQKNENYFENAITKYFDGHHKLYIGDLDFKFADETVNVIGEIKTISKNGHFQGKKVSLNQIREYASMSNLIDNYGRTTKTYLFEYHQYLKKPYVIAIPIIYNKYGQKTTDYIDLNNALMLYIHKDNQLCNWLNGTLKNTYKPKRPLLCI